MTVGLKASVAQAILDALLNATAYTGPATLFAQLHIADPGAAGTANIAANSTRQAIGFGAAASGSISNDVAPTWTSVPASEDYSHISVWDASTAGNFLFSAVITANPVTAGDNFSIAVGAAVINLTTVAA